MTSRSIFVGTGCPFFILAMGCSSQSPAPAQTLDPLSGRPSVAFKSRSVAVCWEDITVSSDDDRALVHASVANTWELVDGGLIHFVGCDACTPTSTGVRIEVARKRAYTHAFGTDILGMPNGLTLNSTYGNEYANGCAASETIRKSCLAVDAVHEFGHVLGFSHEENRADIPPTSGCTQAQLKAGLDDATTFAESLLNTMYDPKSVMNYCNPLYWNRNAPANAQFGQTHFWTLSDGDTEGMQTMYGALASVPPAPTCSAQGDRNCGGDGVTGVTSTLLNATTAPSPSSRSLRLGAK